MKLICWNMNGKQNNWSILADLMSEYQVKVALLQEAKEPPQGLPCDLHIFTDPSQPDIHWQIPIPQGRKCKFASAIAVKGNADVELWTPSSLAEVTHGSPTISHPGQWVEISLGDDHNKIYFVSIYGIFDKMENNPIFC
jgi:hypothetical protein